jgi:hypothetical protein
MALVNMNLMNECLFFNPIQDSAIDRMSAFANQEMPGYIHSLESANGMNQLFALLKYIFDRS